MKPRINWRRVWDKFYRWRCRNEIDESFYPFERERQDVIKRLVNAELRGKKKGAKHDRPRTRA